MNAKDRINYRSLIIALETRRDGHRAAIKREDEVPFIDANNLTALDGCRVGRVQQLEDEIEWLDRMIDGVKVMLDE